VPGTITLVGELQASVGARFVYEGANGGPDALCAPCKLQGICFNLEPGETYEVRAVRDKGHPCFLHERGVARVVEVAPSAHDVIIPARGLVAGETFVYPQRQCENRGCDKWSICVGARPRPGATYQVESVGANADCPLDYALRHARLAPRTG
jgi:uncharacterized protein (UPF0179 family)